MITVRYLKRTIYEPLAVNVDAQLTRSCCGRVGCSRWTSFWKMRISEDCQGGLEAPSPQSHARAAGHAAEVVLRLMALST